MCEDIVDGMNSDDCLCFSAIFGYFLDDFSVQFDS